MKTYLTAALALCLVAGAAGAASADQHWDNNTGHHHGARGHSDWRRGGHVAPTDWSRGRQVDWRGRHLRAPPRGYEWREVDGNYVLAAVATGVIADLLLNAR